MSCASAFKHATGCFGRPKKHATTRKPKWQREVSRKDGDYGRLWLRTGGRYEYRNASDGGVKLSYTPPYPWLVCMASPMDWKRLYLIDALSAPLSYAFCHQCFEQIRGVFVFSPPSKGLENEHLEVCWRVSSRSRLLVEEGVTRLMSVGEVLIGGVGVRLLECVWCTVAVAMGCGCGSGDWWSLSNALFGFPVSEWQLLGL